jgi:CRISPR/Cas system-associated exonuclease Cas4 (RecB family)
LPVSTYRAEGPRQQHAGRRWAAGGAGPGPARRRGPAAGHQPVGLHPPGLVWSARPAAAGEAHAALESLAGENAVAETRLIASLEELGARAWIAGKIDHYDPALRLATDYKTINTFGKKMASLELPKQHHVAQLWIYGWLLGKSGYSYPLASRIVYMDMGAVRTVDVPMPDAEMQAAVEARLVEKAQLITEADHAGPPGDPQESWECNYCARATQCVYRIKKHAPGAAADGK